MRHRRFASLLLTAALAVHGLVTASSAFAMAADSTASVPAGHCGGQPTHDPGSCPCCPDGASMAGCLYLCAVHAVTVAPAAAVPVLAPTAAIAFDPQPEPLQTYPPPDPPPIA